MNKVLEVCDLSKVFRNYGKEWRRVLTWFGLPVQAKDEYRALNNISFKAHSGETIGIVGGNGAGKSTLLKLITGTSKPTTGNITVNGCVAAILELGMGFHPDLTGRQNARHAASLMGHSQKQIDSIMDELEKFADIGEHFDQPVRTYSSGMQMRVAFSVATGFRPDLLIVDEALSVGDLAFQRKCFDRIQAFVAAGTCFLFVSHDAEIIKKLCGRALFLKDGRIHLDSSPKAVCDVYEKFLFGGKNVSGGGNKSTTPLEKGNVYGNGQASIEDYALELPDGTPINITYVDQLMIWRFRVKFFEPFEHVLVNMQVKTREGVTIFGVNSRYMEYPIENVRAGEIMDIVFCLNNHFAPGVYYFSCGVLSNFDHGEEYLIRRVDTAILQVAVGDQRNVAIGMVDLGAKLQVSRVEPLG